MSHISVISMPIKIKRLFVMDCAKDTDHTVESKCSKSSFGWLF